MGSALNRTPIYDLSFKLKNNKGGANAPPCTQHTGVEHTAPPTEVIKPWLIAIK